MKQSTITQDKRARIIDAAAELFHNSHHVRKVSMEEIAGKAHVSPTTIYHYFGTRETLVAEVAKSLVLAIIEQSRGFLHSSLPFAQKLQAVISGKIRMTSKVSSEVIEKMVNQDPAMAKFVEEVYRNELSPLWREFVADGKAEGYIDPTLDPDVFMAYLDILRTGFAARSELLGNLRDNQPFLEQMTRLVFYGFLKKEVDLFGKGDRKSQAHPDLSPIDQRKGGLADD